MMTFLDNLSDALNGSQKSKKLSKEDMDSELNQKKHVLELEKINTEILEEKAKQKKLSN